MFINLFIVYKKIYDQLFIHPQKMFKPYSQLTAKILDRTKNMAL